MLNVTNYYERLVSDRLWELMQDPEESHDQDFIEDVACLALNLLQPHYVRHRVDMGSHLTDSEYEEMCRQVDEAVEEAVKKISTRPRKDRD